jgi:hypothetical protein
VTRSVPLSQAEVEAEILRLMGELETKTEGLAELATNAAETSVNFKVAKAEAFLEAEGTMDVRNARSITATKDDALLAEHSLAIYAAAKEGLNTLRVQIDALRTISANVRGQT